MNSKESLLFPDNIKISGSYDLSKKLLTSNQKNCKKENKINNNDFQENLLLIPSKIKYYESSEPDPIRSETIESEPDPIRPLFVSVNSDDFKPTNYGGIAEKENIKIAYHLTFEKKGIAATFSCAFSKFIITNYKTFGWIQAYTGNIDVNYKKKQSELHSKRLEWTRFFNHHADYPVPFNIKHWSWIIWFE